MKKDVKTTKASRKTTAKVPDEKVKKAIGRPTDFNTQIADKIVELAEKGKTDDQIAEIIGCHVNTLRRWVNDRQELKWAVNESKQVADDIVEASLFLRACGYAHESVKIFCEKGEITEHKYVERYPPDTSAAIFWLKNRKRGEWRDRFEEELPQPNNITIQAPQVNEELANKIVEAVEKINNHKQTK